MIILNYNFTLPQLWTPAWYTPSLNPEPSHWYDTAAVPEAKAIIALDLEVMSIAEQVHTLGETLGDYCEH